MNRDLRGDMGGSVGRTEVGRLLRENEELRAELACLRRLTTDSSSRPDASDDMRLARSTSEMDEKPSSWQSPEAQLRLMLASAADYAIITTDPQGRVTSWNTGARNVLGWREAEVLGRDLRLIWPVEANLANTSEQEMRLAAEVGSASDDRWHVRKDGSRFWGSGELLPMRAESGEVVGFLKILNDRTQQRLAEDALRESEERFRHIVEGANDYAIFTMDLRGQIVSWNSGARRILGYEDAEIVGCSTRLLFTAEDRQRLEPESEMRDALARGQIDGERWMRRKDGSCFWASQTMSVLLDNAGAARGYLKILRDRTEARHAHQALRESEQRLALAQEAAGIGSWDLNLATEELRCTAQTFLLWGVTPPGEDGGQSTIQRVLEKIHPEDRERVTAEIRSAVVSHLPFRTEFRSLHPNGAVRWLAGMGRLIAGGEKGRIIGVNMDVTEQKRAERRQQVLISELQHRTRNLLAVVGQISEQTANREHSVHEFVSRLKLRLAALSRVQDVLARSGSDAATLSDLIHGELTAHGAEVDGERVIVGGPPIPLRPETAQTLALAVHELATNAVKYGALSHAKGRLATTWDVIGDQSERWLSLEWRESGVPAHGGSEMPRRGYGRQLIEDDLPYELDAQTSLEIGPDGVRCTVLMPLTNETRDYAGPLA